MRARQTVESREKRQPFQVRLPGFISDKEVGLGDVIKRVTAAVGIGSCGACAQRAAVLNSKVVFTGRRTR